MTLKYRPHRWNDTRKILCVVFVIARQTAFAEPDSKENGIGTHDVTDISINTASWETRNSPTMHLRFKLPPGYKEKQWAVVVGTPEPSATFRLGHENQIDFSVQGVEDTDLENAKVGVQKDFVDYKEWSQLIGGHNGIVQTFQGGGKIMDEEGERLPYCVEATCTLDEKHLLWIRAALGSQARQKEVLAMLTTIEFH
jgi:hypothetical protein